MHISLPISSETMLMGSDIGGPWASNFIHGNNFSISVNTESAQEADKLYKGLSEGGHATMPMSKTFGVRILGCYPTSLVLIGW